MAPAARDLVQVLLDLAETGRDVPMLSRTHGQPATPTTLGKEMAVLAYRLKRQISHVAATEFFGQRLTAQRAPMRRITPRFRGLTGRLFRGVSWSIWGLAGTR